MIHRRVLWEQVPDAVKDDLKSRESPRVGDTAISEALAGQRWYFRRTEYGWNNISMDDEATPAEVASDLTPADKARAMADSVVRDVATKVLESILNKMMKASMSRMPTETTKRRVPSTGFETLARLDATDARIGVHRLSQGCMMFLVPSEIAYPWLRLARGMPVAVVYMKDGLPTTFLGFLVSVGLALFTHSKVFNIRVISA